MEIYVLVTFRLVSAHTSDVVVIRLTGAEDAAIAEDLVPHTARTDLGGAPIFAHREIACRISVDGRLVLPQDVQLVSGWEVPITKSAIGQVFAQFECQKRCTVRYLCIVQFPVIKMIGGNIIGPINNFPLA